MSFLDDVGLTATAGDEFTATLHPTWRSMVGIHGGYVAAVTTAAVLRSVDPGRALRNLDVQFTRPPTEGPITIRTEPVSAGRTMTFTRAVATQRGRPVLIATAVLGTDRGGLEFDEVAKPSWAGSPPPPSAERFVGTEPGHHFEQLDLRLEPGLRIFGHHATARVAGWLRPIDPGEPITTPWLVCAADAMPPSMVFRTDRPVQAASIAMSIQLVAPAPGAVPAGSTVFLDARTSISSRGFLVEDGTIWSPDGTILATSRQLRLSGVD